ncbi:hypothetical protein D6D27_06047, partial [Aureobasidium pullulans]
MTDSSLLGALEDLHIDGHDRRALPLRTRPSKTLAPTTTSSPSCARSSQLATASSISSNSSSAVLRAHRAAALSGALVHLRFHASKTLATHLLKSLAAHLLKLRALVHLLKTLAPQATRRALPQAPQTSQVQRSRRASLSPVRVPDPPEFDNKTPFAPWLVKMKLKLNMELSHVNEQTKMDYILSRTSGSVFDRFILCVHGQRSDLVFRDSADCLYQLKEWYGDRHRESRAYTDFELLRQRDDESFGDFYTRFQDLVGYLNLPESLLILKLKYKLNDRFGYYINDGKIYAFVRELVDRGDRLDADIHLLPDDPYTTD